MSSCVHVIDPLTDPRWDGFLERHPRASVFHSRGWLEALKRTYGFEPAVLTTTGREPLENGLLFCRLRTCVSKRLVSLPFSDHCDPLVGSASDLRALLEALKVQMREGRWRSFELRPRHVEPADLPMGARYWLHTLDLRRPAAEIFRAFSASNTQRAIRRAEREGLVCESGNSDALVSRFFGLLRLTRRRHGLPPQPFAWFTNLASCLGDRLTIYLASWDGRPVAGILTLSLKTSLVYKYGGSDSRYHSLGAMPFLFWRAIQDATARGMEEFDLGRSDLDQPGLIAFKDHLGAVKTPLTYYSYPSHRPAAAHAGPLARAARRIVSHLPDAALDLTGRLLYRHLG